MNWKGCGWNQSWPRLRYHPSIRLQLWTRSAEVSLSLVILCACHYSTRRPTEFKLRSLPLEPLCYVVERNYSLIAQWYLPHGSEILSQAFHHGDLGSVPGQTKCDLWLKTWNTDKFLSGCFGFLLSFYGWSTFIRLWPWLYIRSSWMRQYVIILKKNIYNPSLKNLPLFSHNLCVSPNSQNKSRLFPYTELTCWF